MGYLTIMEILDGVQDDDLWSSEPTAESKEHDMDIKKVQPYVLGAMIALPLSLFSQVPDMPVADTTSHNTSQTSPGTANNNRSMQDSSQNGSVTDDFQGTKDKMFVRKVSETGYAQVQLGQLAVQKASSPDVKKLGQKMVDDHKQLAADMAPVSDEYGVREPTKLAKADQEEYDKLNALSGADFDKEYLAYTLKDHRQDLGAFHREQKTTRDPALQDALASGVKVIAEHLYAVNQLALANGVPGAFQQKPASSTASAGPVPAPPAQLK